jgi:hypothetical protein
MTLQGLFDVHPLGSDLVQMCLTAATEMPSWLAACYPYNMEKADLTTKLDAATPCANAAKMVVAYVKKMVDSGNFSPTDPGLLNLIRDEQAVCQ